MITKRLAWIAAALLAGCGVDVDSSITVDADEAETPDEFVERVNRELEELGTEVAAANWVRATYINADTGLLAARAAERYAEWLSRTAADAGRFDNQDMSAASARALHLLKLSTPEPAPGDAARRKELAEIATELPGMYNTASWCPEEGGDCLHLQQIEKIVAESRDPAELAAAWTGWHDLAAPMRPKYRRFVELANAGARELGYGDLGEMWRDHYDMSPAAFEAETNRLWDQVKPLYEQLHCHVRATLGDFHGEGVVTPAGPIPAHLLGNMWAQTWTGIYDLLEPYPGTQSVDVDSALQAQGYTPERMVRSAEGFYTSMGLPELPGSFWERSLLAKPADREVQCHASAWQIGWDDDVRIKMCLRASTADLRVIYHELGHVYYYLAIQDLPPLFQAGAHDGFHEAVGDAVNMSMTPAYLHRIGLLEGTSESYEATINRQMYEALTAVAFLPFGKLIDEWRWAVFDGRIAPENYNSAWWELRERYQGVVAPVPRDEGDFDPGAKYHVPANTPYSRYFLAFILQYQFQRALCDAAGHDGPLHECSVYGSATAGERLWSMLSKGASQPWQDTLEELTGTREMDARAILDYFQPLADWLAGQNAGRSCGW
ncbi:MAG: M2 family metallopeptidase [Gammaproteobacteria bacterium]|nr:M2 family metallopeptidase [Gammaproteobacteria bacterium]MDH4255801.1 M2 family metallopeptidase [Gammaproteobacteria bacterium]MDH5311452.1 M2 family metallopeptidase [Gammaproteobacteria bacterium]